MKRIAVLLILFTWPVLCVGQVTHSPEFIDFGRVPAGIDDYVPTYTRVAELTNLSESAVFVELLYGYSDVEFYRPDYGGMIQTERIFGGGTVVESGDRLFVRLRRRFGGPLELPYTYRDTVLLRVSDPEMGTPLDSITIPVTGEIVESSVPVVVVPEHLIYGACLCRFEGPKFSYSISGPERFNVLNPVGSAYPLTIDSFTVEPLAGSRITQEWFSDAIRYWDDSAKKQVTRQPPVILQPGRGGAIDFEVPLHYGEQRSRLRVYGRYQDGSETPWVGEDTISALERGEGIEPLSLNPSRPVFMVASGTAVHGDYGFGLFKCELSDSVPVWLDTAYFVGPRQPALALVKPERADSMPVFPVFLRCNVIEEYNVKITRALTFPGITTDTITAEYHYEDPERGRVDGVTKVTVQIDIQGSTVSVREDWGTAVTVEFSPNPARDRLRVVCGSLGNSAELRLYDLQGHDVLGQLVPFSSSGVAEIDVSGLPAGAYQAVVIGEGERLIVSRSVMVVR